MVDLELLAMYITFGFIFGFIIGYFVYWNKERRIRKMAKKKLEKDERFIEKKALKPCLICGLMTTGDVCSVEHQQQWIKNQTQLSEGKQEPKKEEDISGKG